MLILIILIIPIMLIINHMYPTSHPMSMRCALLSSFQGGAPCRAGAGAISHTSSRAASATTSSTFTTPRPSRTCQQSSRLICASNTVTTAQEVGGCSRDGGQQHHELCFHAYTPLNSLQGGAPCRAGAGAISRTSSRAASATTWSLPHARHAHTRASAAGADITCSAMCGLLARRCRQCSTATACRETGSSSSSRKQLLSQLITKE
jgi:hypothetical protein